MTEEEMRYQQVKDDFFAEQERRKKFQQDDLQLYKIQKEKEIELLR